jgi:hypothetical protein
MVQPGPVSSTSRLDVALPFIFTVAALVLSVPIGAFVAKRLAKWVEWRLRRDLNAALEEPPAESVLRPETSAEISALLLPWAIDVSQAIPTLTLPAASLAILTSGHGLRAATVGLYIGAIVVGLAAFLVLATGIYPGGYVRRGRWGFSPLIVMGVLVNAAAAVIAYALGP